MTMQAPAARRPRHADGRFAAYDTAEADVELTTGPSPEDVLAGLPEWTPPAGTDTRAGAFDRCKKTSADYTRFLRDHGVDAEWVQLYAATRSYPDSDPRWHGIERTFWGHYVTRVGEHYIDFTMRQFDPEAGHPHVTPVRSGDWEDEYPIAEDALDHYLATTRHR